MCKEEARKIIHNAIVELAGVPVFEQKLEVMNTLLDLEWSLIEHKETKTAISEKFVSDDLAEDEIDYWDDPYYGGRETPWNG